MTSSASDREQKEQIAQVAEQVTVRDTPDKEEPPMTAQVAAPNEPQEEEVTVEDNDEEALEAASEETTEAGAMRAQQGTRWECKVCGFTRNTKNQMEKHMKTHILDEEDASHTCRECPFQAINRDQLVEHLYKKHNKHTKNICKHIS